MDSSLRTGSLDEELSARQVQLIRTTYRLIGERGTSRVTLREVAEAAGMSKGLIPYYFESKENLLLATMRWVLSEVAERIRRAVAGAETPEERILAMVEVIFLEPEANRRFYLVYLDLVERAVRLHRFGELSATFQTIVNSLYAEVIRSGVAQGAFAVPDVDEAAVALRAIVDGLFLQWLQEEEWAAQHLRYRDACQRAALMLLRSGAALRPAS